MTSAPHSSKMLRMLAAIMIFSVLVCISTTGGARADTLYGVSGASFTSSSLYTIDSATGASTLIGATGVNHMTSLDYDDVTGLLYGISNETNSLYTINTTTGAASVLGVLSGGMAGSNAPDMSFDSSGGLYTWSENSTDILNRIDLGTQVTTEIGAMF